MESRQVQRTHPIGSNHPDPDCRCEVNLPRCSRIGCGHEFADHLREDVPSSRSCTSCGYCLRYAVGKTLPACPKCQLILKAVRVNERRCCARCDAPIDAYLLRILWERKLL